MANERQLERLKQGLAAWNDWRKDNWSISIDLHGADFSGANLYGTNLYEANLSGADLSGADLRNADLSGANLIEANLSRANLSGVDFNGANLYEANLSGADLRNADLSGANLIGANLIEANLSRANLSGVDFSGTHLRKTNLSGANLILAKLIRVDLSGTNLSGADLSGVDLSGTNFSGTNFSGTNFSGTNLSEVDLSGAKLSGANFSGANFSGAKLSGLDFNGSDLSETNLSGTILSRIQALDTNFTGATFTGACIEDWHINSETRLDDVECDYIYFKGDNQERRPSDPSRNFAPGEFTKRVQEARNTFDLIFHNGVNWRAFAFVFNETNTEVIDEYGDRLFLRGYELLGDGIVKLKISYPEGANRQKYQNLLEESYELVKENKGLLKENARLRGEDYEKMLSLPSRIIFQIGENNSVNDTFNNDFQGANIANFANKLEGNTRQQAIVNNFSLEQKQSLAEAAVEIQQLLNQLAQTNSKSESEIVEAVHQEIKRNPTLKARLLGALKAGGLETLKAIFNHPAVSIPAETVKGWLEAE